MNKLDSLTVLAGVIAACLSILSFAAGAANMAELIIYGALPLAGAAYILGTK